MYCHNILQIFIVWGIVGNGSGGLGTNEQVAEQIRETIEKYRGQMTKGIPEFNIPVLEPFELQHPLNIHEDKDSTEISLSVPSGRVIGLSNFNITKLVVNAGLIKADVILEFENLRNEGYYKLDGIIIGIFPIFGNGSYWLQAQQVIAVLGIDLQLTIDLTLRVQNISFTSTAKEVTGHFDNLLGGGSIGSILNRILNRISEKVLKLHMPDVFEKVTAALKVKLNEELKKHPITDFFTTRKP